MRRSFPVVLLNHVLSLPSPHTSHPSSSTRTPPLLLTLVLVAASLATGDSLLAADDAQSEVVQLVLSLLADSDKDLRRGSGASSQ